MESELVQISKFLSYVLRHKPDAIGLVLDSNGWASVDDLLSKATQSGHKISIEDLLSVVQQNDKKRFSLSDDMKRIRAAQGHSVEIDLALESKTPPELLFHGTATRFLDSILVSGIKAGSRQQVHLSCDKETALKVGQRHGKPIVLSVKALEMHRQGFKFFLADNGVWLTEMVPPDYLIIDQSFE